MPEFHNDDLGFERWRDSHPRGYIVTQGNPLVHRGNCNNMKSFIVITSKMTTRKKYCFETEAELEAWARTGQRALRRNCKNCGS